MLILSETKFNLTHSHSGNGKEDEQPLEENAKWTNQNLTKLF